MEFTFSAASDNAVIASGPIFAAADKEIPKENNTKPTKNAIKFPSNGRLSGVIAAPILIAGPINNSVETVPIPKGIRPQNQAIR